jgi:signal transduction histidine kinase
MRSAVMQVNIMESRPGHSQPSAVSNEEQLEALVKEGQARNEELRAAKEEAERANAAKDEFLAMLSHELRTPLTPVLSIVSATLEEGNLPPDLRHTFDLIRRNVQLEARLIEDLLNLSQVLSGRLQIHPEPLDLHNCINAAIDLCRADLEARRVEISTEYAEGADHIVGDAARLQQLFWSLLRNAGETASGGARMEIVTRREGGQLIVEVKDQGLHISSERLTSMLEALENSPGTPRFGSLGLSLAIARSIAEAHGGTLSAGNPVEGHGVVFSLVLPDGMDIASPERPEQDPRQAGRRGGPTILVVEDHEDTRRVLARALRRKGFGIRAAASVESACEQFADQPADLVICDIGLPDGTGWDVIRKLRGKGPVRAIAVSGYGMDHDLQRSREAGFSAHITKPVDFPRLEAIITSLLKTEPV